MTIQINFFKIERPVRKTGVEEIFTKLLNFLHKK